MEQSLPLNPKNKSKQADKWMQLGIQNSEGFVRSFEVMKRQALEAGFFFLQARAEFEHGEWTEFLLGYSHKIKTRRVQYFMQLASAAVEWVKKENPELL